jgi:(R,R)-butanediol dehydrogenase/meso-butanediol dehydrogenase/diacetyl reductase
MRAAAMTGIGQPLEVVDLPDPEPGSGELVLRIDSCGICGSDLHLVDVFDVPGLVLGHEFCGEVEAIGSDVEGWSVGDRATALSLATCGTCDACREGRIRQCATVQMIGIEVPGAYAEYVRVPAHDARRLPGSVTAELGALIEPLAVARHGVERGGVQPGDDVLVMGAGPVGLATAVWLESFGANAVAVSDPQAARLARATGVGADVLLDPTRGEVGELFAEQVGRWPDVVIECVGLPGLIEQAATAAGDGGRVSVVGVCMAEDTFVPYTSISKELDLNFALYYRAQDYLATIAAIDAGTFDPATLITGETSLADLPDRFESLKRPNDDAKVLVKPHLDH